MAVQALYQSEITGADLASVAQPDTVIPDSGTLPPYALDLLANVQAHLADIDARISEASENWSLSRMPIVDRAILRCAVCEMFYMEDVPVAVCINEAVELAKSFGGEDESARFANGILGRIARTSERQLAGEGASAVGCEPQQGADAAPGAADEGSVGAECRDSFADAGVPVGRQVKEAGQEAAREQVL